MENIRENDSTKRNLEAIHSRNHTIFKLFFIPFHFPFLNSYHNIAIIEIRFNRINKEANGD